jgi:hypothetical protein
MNYAARHPGLIKFGWRLCMAMALVIAGYSALLLIPVVIATDFEPKLKAAMTGVLGLAPLLTKLAAIAIIGKPAFTFIKHRMVKFLQNRSSRAEG